MRKTYKKQAAPAWQRRLVVFVGGLFAATLLLFVAWAIVLFIDWKRIDDCLDDGGSYDYEQDTCDFEENHRPPD